MFKNSLISKIIKRVLLISLIPLLVFSVILYYNSANEMEIKIIQDANNTLDMMAVNVKEKISKYTKIVEMMAESNEVKSLDYLQAEPYFKDMVNRDNEVWSHFLIANGEGTEIAHSEGEEHHGKNIINKEYFSYPWNNQKTIVAEPTFSTSTGRKIMGIGVPIIVNGQNLGVLDGFIKIDYISEILNKYNLTKNSYVFMLNSDGRVSAHPDSELVLKRNWVNPSDEESKTDSSKMSAEFKNILNEMTELKSGEKIVNINGEKALVVYRPLELNGMSLAMIIPNKEAFASTYQTRNFLGVYIIILSLIIIIASYFIAKQIVNPINHTNNMLKDIAEGEGDLTRKLKIAGNDELGDLTKYFNLFVTKIHDLIFKVKENTDSITTASNNLASVVEEMSSASQGVTTTIQDIAEGTGNQSSNLNHIKGILDNFSHQLDNMVLRIDEVNKNSEASRGMVDQGRQKMDVLTDSVNSMNSTFGVYATKISNLGNNLKQINEITDVMNGIADQTNLLALNASIEAARAGEAGKGFAVVAEEIRKLAEESKKSAENINSIITTVSDETKEIVSTTSSMDEKLTDQVAVIENAIDSFQKIDESIDMALPKIKEINIIAINIDKEKNEILEKIIDVSDSAEKSSASSEEIAASSEEMNASAEEVDATAQVLKKMTDDLTEQVNMFKL